MRGQGEGVITPRGNLLRPIGAERALGSRLMRLLGQGGPVDRGSAERIEFWVALNQEKFLDPGWGSWKETLLSWVTLKEGVLVSFPNLYPGTYSSGC